VKLQKKTKLNKIKPGDVYRLISPYGDDWRPILHSPGNKAIAIEIGQEIMVLEIKRVNYFLSLYVIFLGEETIGWMNFTNENCKKWKKIL